MRFEETQQPQTVTFTVTATLKELRGLYDEFFEIDYEDFQTRFPMSYALLENFPATYEELPIEFSLDD